MKLVHKLTLALAGGTMVILAANGVFRVEREVKVLHTDRARDHDLIGRSLGAAVSAVWRADGRASALSVIDAANTRRDGIRARWVDANTTPGPRIPQAALSAIAAGETVTTIAKGEDGEEGRVTYVPVEAEGARQGALELSESLATEGRRVRGIIVDTVVATITLAVVSGALSVLLGMWLVGRPVRALAEKARRIGRGDFGGKVELRQKDELAELAEEMNAMCDRLLEARDRVAEETAARIATLEQLRHADRLMTVGKLASGIAHELGHAAQRGLRARGHDRRRRGLGWRSDGVRQGHRRGDGADDRDHPPAPRVRAAEGGAEGAATTCTPSPSGRWSCSGPSPRRTR